MHYPLLTKHIIILVNLELEWMLLLWNTGGTFISTHLRSIWWLLKTLDHSVSIKSPSMKPLEERISTHLATWGNNGGGRGGMEQMTTESLHNHMINKELCRRYIFIYIYILYIYMQCKTGLQNPALLYSSHCCNHLTYCNRSKVKHMCN